MRRDRKRRPAVVLVIAVVSLAACGSTDMPSGGSKGEGVFFPTYRETGISPLGMLEGELVEQDGCLISQGIQGSLLLLWPDSYAYESGEPAMVVDGDGDRIAKVGALVQLAGGERTLDDAIALTGQSIPEECQAENYWIVAGPA
jgi:hypothetical protein